MAGGRKEEGENKIQQNQPAEVFFRVSLHKETLACNLATATTTTKVLVAHIPDKQRNV